jgi:DNA-binding transcriptional ArsR family regulator
VAHPSKHTSAEAPLSEDEATAIAEEMKAFSAPSRVRILYALLEDPRTVDELATVVEMNASAVSQQLRVLRQLRYVVAEREGRHLRYRLHDHHMGDLLSAIRHHQEHAHG